MKLLKPSWVNHDDKPIFSVDIHPAGKRFATGGQGGDSGRVVVWNLNSVLYETVEVDPNVPKMLCQMDNHLACVNCVRWSNGGKYLASGGDDRLVMVWGLSVAPGTPGKHKAETWRCLATLRGHAGDVLDLAWSPLDKWLASCSVDNTIIIWNAEKFPEMVCVLNGHTGLVKGVAWDPVGKYLASQSDDKSLRVWKTADWAQETVITEPFEECGGTTHVLRLSWSPDGQYVLSAHAMNGGGPTAQVVERDGWRCDKDFVGHRKAVTCARFNNNIFVKEGKKCCCAAVGSRDRALSIWLTSLKRPLVVIHDLFSDSVLDLSWSSDGLNLLSCSSDGSVACIQFTNKEIGTPLSIDEKNAFYEKIYGKCLANESGDLSSNLLVECPEILLAREKQEAKKQPVKEDTTPKSEKSQWKTSSLSASTGSPAPGPLRPMDRQIETRTSDGKRRITPVFIPLTQADANESLGSIPGGGENCFSTSSQSKSRIVVEVRDDIVIHPNVSNHAISNLNNTHRNRQPGENTTEGRPRKRSGCGLPGPRAECVQAKRACASPAGPAAGGGPAHGPAGPPPPALPAPALGVAGPVVRAAGLLRLQVVNKACNTHYGTLSRLQLLPNNSVSNDPVWETYLGSSVSCIACCARWACVSCVDGTLHAWSLQRLHAARALPPIALPSQACKLTLTGDTLAVITTSAELAMWDLATATCTIRPLCFRCLLSHGVTVTNCALLEDGNPMISLSNGKSYIYCKKLSAWVVWADASDPVWRSCGAVPAARAPRAARGLYPPARRTNAAPTAYSASSYSAGAARSWLEAQVSSCLHLRLAKDYRHWVTSLFGHLVNHGNIYNSSNVCSSYSAGAARSWLEAQVSSCLHLRLAKDYRHWVTSLFGHLVNHGNIYNSSHVSSSYSAGAVRSWLEAQVSSCLHLRLAKDYRHWVTSLFGHLVNHGNIYNSSNVSSSYSAGAARSWLEAQVSSCLHLRLAKDYRHWVTSLFGHLVNHGTEEQLRTILDDMLGPSHCTSTPKKWQSTILGIKKHEILEEMLSLLVRQLRWQRMYSEYSDQLNDVKAANTTLLNGH